MACSFSNQGPAGTFRFVNGDVSMSSVTHMNLTQTHRERKSIHFQIYDPEENFTGRADEISHLENETVNHQSLHDHHEAPIVVVSGMGGIGKTQLVRQFIYKNKSYYTNIIWINSQNQSLMEQEFRALATNSLYIEKANEKDFIILIEEVFDVLSVSPTVIVLDNIDETRNTEIFKLLVKIGTRPHIIITSRIKEWPNKIRTVNLEPWKQKEALDYVSVKLTGNSDSLEDKMELVERLQYFPLALRQATSHINYRRIVEAFPISDYISEFNSCIDRMLDSKIFQSHDFDSYKKTTWTTWEVSIAAINKDGDRGTLAVRILRIIASFDATHIRRDIFRHLKFPLSKQIKDIEVEVKQAVQLLVNNSMIDGYNLQSELSIHRLVQQVIKIEMENNPDINKTILWDGLYILSQLDDIRDNLEHGISVYLMALKFKELVCEFFSFPLVIIKSLLQYGQYHGAINFVSEIGPPLIKCFGGDYSTTKHSNKSQKHQNFPEKVRKNILWQVNPDTFNSKLKLIASYVGNDHYSDKTLVDEQMANLKCHDWIFNRNHNVWDNILMSQGLKICISFMYDDNTSSLESFALSQRVIDNRKSNIEEDSKNILSSDSHFSITCGKDADLPVLSVVTELVTEEDSENLFTSGSHLSIEYGQKTDLSESIVLSHRSIENFINSGSHLSIEYGRKADRSKSIDVSHRVIKGDSENRINSAPRVSIEYADRSKSKTVSNHVIKNRKSNIEEDSENILTSDACFIIEYKREADLSKSILVLQDVKEKDSENILISDARFIIEYERQADLSESIDVQQDVKEKNSENHRSRIEYIKHAENQQPANKQKIKLVDYNHPNVLDIQFYFANIYSLVCPPSMAFQIHKTIFEKRKQSLGENHPDTLESMSKVAASYNYLGKHSEALSMHREVFEKRRKISGDYHLHTLECKLYIAASCNHLRKYDEALKMYEDLLESLKYVLGEDNPQTFIAISNIAALYARNEKQSKALQMYREVFEKQKTVLGENHRDTLKSMSKIADSYNRLGSQLEVLQMYQEVYEKQKQLFGDNAAVTLHSKSHIATSYNNLGKHSEALRMHEEIFLTRSSILGDDHPLTLGSKLSMELSCRNVAESRHHTIILIGFLAHVLYTLYENYFK